MKNDKILLLFTSSFPFGKGEEFLETEIIYVAKAFKEVHIFPLKQEGPRREIPSNVKTISSPLYQKYKTGNMILRNGFFALGFYLRQILLTKNKKKYIFKFYHHLRYLFHRINDAEKLGALMQEYNTSRIVIYSFWFNMWVTVLILARKKNFFNYPILTRALGGDFIEARRKSGYFPFRSTELLHIDKIIPNSNFGKEYLKQNYSVSDKKVYVSYLGVSENGTNPSNSSNEYHLVSCSFMLPVKRIHLIVEILKHIPLKIKWTHIGEGALIEEIKQAALSLNSNVSTNFTGYISKEEMVNFYKNTPIDLFMNVSEMEGLPVSVTEAMSYGIPSTGCKTCGVPEIVTEKTGFLFPKYFEPEKAAAIIQNYLSRDHSYKVNFRKQVKNFWLEKFNADKIYPEFIQNFLSD